MRIVDEVPNNRRAKYPWDEIGEAVETGKVVALDSADYGAKPSALYVAARSHSERNHLGWVVNQRDSVVYISA